MGERVAQITQKTMLPLAMVATLIAIAWGLATDRQKALGDIASHEKRITLIEQSIGSAAESLRRIELKLGIDTK